MTESAEVPELKTTPSLHAGRGRRFRLRFSVLSLLVVAAIVCVGAAFYGMRQREVAAAKQLATLRLQHDQQAWEIARLRAELGYLTISDKSKIHVLQLPTRDDFHWKWRVFLPPGRRWKLLGGLGRLPAHGYEGVPHALSTVESGEFTLEAVMGKDRDGHPELVYGTAVSTTRMPIEEGDFEKLAQEAFGSRSAGQGTMEIRDPGLPVELLRFRAHERRPAGDGNSRLSSNEPQLGFLLWIEAARPGE